MRAVPAARYLVEFGRPQPPAPAAAEPVGLVPKGEPIEARLEAARRQGREDAQADMQALLDAAKAETEQHAVNRVAAARATWIAELGESLATSLATGWSELRESLGESVAAILKPVVSEAIRAKATERLIEALDALITTDEPSVISVEGPQDLIDVLAEKTAGRGVHVELRASDIIDVRIRADRTVIETRLADWAMHLANA